MLTDRYSRQPVDILPEYLRARRQIYLRRLGATTMFQGDFDNSHDWCAKLAIKEG
jgi:hypothetical protein